MKLTVIAVNVDGTSVETGKSVFVKTVEPNWVEPKLLNVLLVWVIAVVELELANEDSVDPKLIVFVDNNVDWPIWVVIEFKAVWLILVAFVTDDTDELKLFVCILAELTDVDNPDVILDGVENVVIIPDNVELVSNDGEATVLPEETIKSVLVDQFIPVLSDCVVCELDGLFVRVVDKTLLLPSPVDNWTVLNELL